MNTKLVFYILFILSLLNLIKNKHRIDKHEIFKIMLLFTCIEGLPLLIYPVGGDELFNKYNLFGSFFGNYLVTMMSIIIYYSTRLIYNDYYVKNNQT